MRISEGIHGTYFYHYSDHPKSLRALCGVQTMATAIPLSSWGYKDHLNERYCDKCEVIFAQMKERNHD